MKFFTYRSYSIGLREYKRLLNYLAAFQGWKDWTGKKRSNSITAGHIWTALAECDPSETCLVMWNGSEMGCEFVLHQARRCNVPTIFVERGVFPQTNKLRFLIDPVATETNLGYPPSPNGRDVCNSDRVRNDSNIITVVAQASHDSSLYQMKHPRTEFPKMVRDRLIEMYGAEEYGRLQFRICFHPHWVEDAWLYDWSVLTGEPIDSSASCTRSELPTLEQASLSRLSIGFNSTTFYELAMADEPCIALCDRHPINHMTSKADLLSKASSCQISTEEIDGGKFMEKHNRYMELTGNKPIFSV
jgi:hypothetical protein